MNKWINVYLRRRIYWPLQLISPVQYVPWKQKMDQATKVTFLSRTPLQDFSPIYLERSRRKVYIRGFFPIGYIALSIAELDLSKNWQVFTTQMKKKSWNWDVRKTGLYNNPIIEVFIRIRDDNKKWLTKKGNNNVRFGYGLQKFKMTLLVKMLNVRVPIISSTALF